MSLVAGAGHPVALSFAVALASLLAGCGEAPSGQGAPRGYYLVTEEIWSGAELVLLSPDFQGLRETVRIVVDGDTFPSVYRHADTVVFRPTTLRSGTYDLAVLPAMPPAENSRDQVTIRGFGACYEGPPMSGYPLAWPDRDLLSTFLADGTESAIIVDAAAGQSRPAVPPAAHRPGVGTGPGWAYEAFSVVLTGTEFEVPGAVLDSTCLWRLEPNAQRGECRPEYSRYRLALVGPGKWVFATHHYTSRTYGDWATREQELESPDGLTVSPRGDYVVVSGSHDDGQLLVPVADSMPIVRIPFLWKSEAPAAFTPDGDTVFMAGFQEHRDTVMTLVVFQVDRPTELAAALDLDVAFVGDLAVDPVAPYLYVLHSDGTITVLDRGTLRRVATLRTPGGGCGSGWGLKRFRLARNWDALYVIESFGVSVPSWIYHYDLLASQR